MELEQRSTRTAHLHIAASVGVDPGAAHDREDVDEPTRSFLEKALAQETAEGENNG